MKTTHIYYKTFFSVLLLLSMVECRNPEREPKPEVFTGCKLLSEKHNGSVVRELTYDSNGRPKTFGSYPLEYDEEGHLIRFFHGEIQVVCEYLNGRLSKVTNEYHKVNFEYTTQGQLSKVIHSEFNGRDYITNFSNNKAISRSYTSKPGDRENTVWVFQDGRLVKLIAKEGSGVDYEYDSRGRPIRISLFGEGRKLILETINRFDESNHPYAAIPAFKGVPEAYNLLFVHLEVDVDWRFPVKYEKYIVSPDGIMKKIQEGDLVSKLNKRGFPTHVSVQVSYPDIGISAIEEKVLTYTYQDCD